MLSPSDILKLLTGARVYDGASWRVEDSLGVDIGAAIMQGAYGAILTTVNKTKVPDSIQWGYGGVVVPTRKRKTRQQLQNEQLLLLLA